MNQHLHATEGASRDPGEANPHSRALPEQIDEARQRIQKTERPATEIVGTADDLLAADSLPISAIESDVMFLPEAEPVGNDAHDDTSHATSRHHAPPGCHLVPPGAVTAMPTGDASTSGSTLCQDQQDIVHSNHVSPRLFPIDLDMVADDQFWNQFASYDIFDVSGSPLVDKAIDKVRQVRQEVENSLLTRGRGGVNKTDIEVKLRKRFAALKRQVDTKTRVISDKLTEAPMVRLRDRLSFLLGVTGMWCSAMIMAGWPQYVPLAYTVKIVILVTARFIIYRKKQWHYFLFDMCYVVNLLLLMYLYILPESRSLFTVIFGLSHGPLAWAILAWRNSMVFHSFDKVTSVAVHFEPPMTLFTLRWFHAAPKHGEGPQTPVGTDETMGLGLLAYFLWQTAYYFFVEKGRAHKIRGGSGRVTSYTWLLSDTKNPIHKLITAFGEQSALAVFMSMQFIYTVLTLLPVSMFSRNIYFHAAFLFTMFSVSVWNGANYYFSGYFARVNLENLRSELKGLGEAVSSNSVSAWTSTSVSPAETSSADETEGKREGAFAEHEHSPITMDKIKAS